MALKEVDFSKIDPRYEGFWVMIRLRDDEQEVIAQGESALEAISQTKAQNIDPTDPALVLTEVPEVPSAAWLADPGDD